MQAIAVPGTSCHLCIVDNAVLLAHWTNVEPAVRQAFAGATFNDPADTIEEPLRHTRAGLNGHLGRRLRHILAKDAAGCIIGAIFCVPTRPEPGRAAGDIGWVFLARHVPRSDRLPILDAMVDQALKLLGRSGFRKIVTRMGTAAGHNAFVNRYRFVYEPDTVQGKKCWVKYLD